MEYGCIGEHLRHSFSAEIHRELADYQYEIREIAPDALDAFLTERPFCGINVTIPYKERVIPHLDEIDGMARAVGAVNTIVNRDGRLCGYNTDVYGMTRLIERIGLDLGGKKVAILGTGGTSRTARAVADRLGAATVLTAGRTAREGVIDYDTLYRLHADTEILINTTPCGMFPYPNGHDGIVAAAVDVSRFPRLCGVVDAVYNPLRSRLILDAQARGIAAEGGLFMLVAQAVRACEIFLGKDLPSDTCERVFMRILREKENLVLIGMPASGKTTVGGLLAQMSGRPLVDSDELIVRAAGKSISDIFASEGETAFRDLESRVIEEEIADRNGLIIATGGGAILSESNLDALRRNGRLYFLDRPLEALCPTDDRPLASTADAIRARYEERYGRYCAAADCRIDASGSPEAVADAIRKEFHLS